MRICVVGVGGEHSTSTGMENGLRACGHEVLPFDYRAESLARGVPGMCAALCAAAKGQDAIVFCKAYGPEPVVVPPTVMAMLGQQARTVYWFADSIFVQGPMALELGAACHRVSATSLESCTAFAEAGCPSVNQTFEGFDPDVFRYAPAKKKRDITFCGNDDEHRLECLLHLRLRRMPVDRPRAFGADLCRVYRESKIVLNFVRGEIFSDRVIQVMASGAFLLTEWCQDIRAAFGDKPLGGTFRGKQELAKACRFWLGDDVERECRAARGNEAVQCYTWTRQAAKLVRIIEGGTVYDGAFRPKSVPRTQAEGEKFVTGPGYDPETYWKNRLGHFGFDLRGAGRIDLTTGQNEDMHREAWGILRGAMGNPPLGRVLDIGCGQGFFAERLAEAGVQQYLGVDVTDVLHADMARRLPPHFRLKKLDIGKDNLPDEKFDVALMIDVTQHLVDPAAFAHAMQEVSRHLAPGGLFLVTSWLDPSARCSSYERSRGLDDYRAAFPGWTFAQPVRFRDKWLLTIRAPQEEAKA